MIKKIMHVAQCAGGVEEYLELLIRNMDNQKYDNILVSTLDYDKLKFKDIVTAHEYVDMKQNINPLMDFKAVLKIRKLIKLYKPDILYTHSSIAGALGRVANIGIKNTCIYNAHGWSFNMDCGFLKKKIYAIIEKILALFCDKIIAISDFERDSAIKNNIANPDKISVIFSGIDTKKYRNLEICTKESLGIPQDAYIIGMVGRIVKQKAPDTFIEAACKIKEVITNAYFIIVGDGDDREKIEKLINEKKLSDSVHITGWVNEPMKYINLFDQAMLLSRWEGFGLVLAEYMIAEKAIIATKIDAIPNLISTNINGILVTVDDVEKIKEACIKLYYDKEFSKRLAKNAYRMVREKFDIDRVVKEYDEILTVQTQKSSLRFEN